jgi:hypothetical protein
MPNIFHQSVEDILKAATPEQRLLWNYIFLRWGERVPISQFYYAGALTGSELGVYSANKLYVAYSFKVSSNSAPSLATPIFLNYYNEANVIFQTDGVNLPFWDATAAAVRYSNSSSESFNIYFSRVANTAGTVSVKFIGYRIGI